MARKSRIKSTEAAPYLSPADPEGDALIARALDLLASRARTHGQAFTDPTSAANFCRLRIGGMEREAFLCVFLDTRHRLIEAEVLFLGTVDGAEVHPREVVKRALQLNASAVLLSHNHPSGNTDPSAADRTVTFRLRDALALVGVRLLDHIIVSPSESLSMAQRGLM